MLTRELLYTGVARSRGRVTVFAPEHCLRRSLQVTGVRQSGLAQLLEQSVL
jgi:ATP-dependent exoDNAse (exonuclease V) alpha subunit